MLSIEDYRANAQRALQVAEAYFKAHKASYEEIKTEGYYNRVLSHDVLLLYNGEMSEDEFVNELSDLIEKQFTRAWYAGADDVGFDRNKITDDDLQPLYDRIAEEFNFVEQYARDITDAAKEGQDVKPLQNRADMWSNRYNEMQNEARIYFSKGTGQMFEWVMGATEEHCATCAGLSGAVATADEWDESGWKPQSQDLECHGFNCQCELQPTDKEKTGIPDV